MLRKYLLVIITFVMIIGYIAIQKSSLVIKESFNAPVFSMDAPAIEASVTTPHEEFLNGVTAYDQEDGDLTDSIVIEKISSGKASNINTIHYLVFDHDGHPSRITRSVVYVDYQEPYFTLVDDLNSGKYSTTEVLKNVRAYSSIDGDISKNITIANAEVSNGNIVHCRLKVSDSTLTTTYLTVKFHVEADSAINIQLNQYLMYTNVGEPIDFVGNIQSIKIGENESSWLNNLVTIDVPDMSEAGVYEVTYTMDYNNLQGKKTLVVVVGGEVNE